MFEMIGISLLTVIFIILIVFGLKRNIRWSRKLSTFLDKIYYDTDSFNKVYNIISKIEKIETNIDTHNKFYEYYDRLVHYTSGDFRAGFLSLPKITVISELFKLEKQRLELVEELNDVVNKYPVLTTEEYVANNYPREFMAEYTTRINERNDDIRKCVEWEFKLISVKCYRVDYHLLIPNRSESKDFTKDEFLELLSFSEENMEEEFKERVKIILDTQ